MWLTISESPCGSESILLLYIRLAVEFHGLICHGQARFQAQRHKMPREQCRGFKKDMPCSGALWHDSMSVPHLYQVQITTVSDGRAGDGGQGTGHVCLSQRLDTRSARS